MRQLPLPGMDHPDEKIVNVASVIHRSPFRYPGGKTWLVPRMRRWLNALPHHPAQFVEPFAGGAIVGLTAAFEDLSNRVTLVELDKQVAAVWDTILTNGEGSWLAEQIGRFDLTIENVEHLLNREPDDLRQRALQTIVKNRVNRGGILASGAGKLKHGDGKGIASRWYPRTLQKRIHALEEVREKITFVHGDGMAVIQEMLNRADTVFFIDPPYTASGKKPGSRLYNHADLDHAALFGMMSAAQGHFLMTYNDDPTIRKLAQKHGFDYTPVAMKNTHHARKTELLIGRHLNAILDG